MSLAEDMAANRRLVVLRALSSISDKRLNETMIGRELDHFGYRLTQSDVRGILRDLEARAAVTTAMAGGVVMIATLTRRGEDHVERRGSPIEGIAQPSLR